MKVFLSVIILLLCVNFAGYADDPPPANGGCEPDSGEICSDEPTPLDDGVYMLIGAAVIYSVVHLRKNVSTQRS